ncbi:MAG: YbaK/EbsC family protein [candidate division KSB1 bacterium]|nr:YbaK/EbsC family protein [candidate division KSB1 bacterium]
MPASRLKQFLDEEGVKYVSIKHSRAYTAQEIAAAMHVPGQELAKTVLVKLDGKMAMIVLPASYTVDLEALRKCTGASQAELAREEEFRELFPDCELGAMPPFGNLYGLPVYVDESITQDKEIVFNACSHTEAIRMAYADYERLVHPTHVRCGRHV